MTSYDRKNVRRSNKIQEVASFSSPVNFSPFWCASSSPTTWLEVQGYEANYLRFSARLPDMQPVWALRISAEATSFSFPSTCALRELQGDLPLPNSSCSSSANSVLEFMVSSVVPSGIYAVEVMGGNPHEVKSKVSWTFEIFEPWVSWKTCDWKGFWKDTSAAKQEFWQFSEIGNVSFNHKFRRKVEGVVAESRRHWQQMATVVFTQIWSFTSARW